MQRLKPFSTEHRRIIGLCVFARGCTISSISKYMMCVCLRRVNSSAIHIGQSVQGAWEAADAADGRHVALRPQDPLCHEHYHGYCLCENSFTRYFSHT
jgi:hypothetical protein